MKTCRPFLSAAFAILAGPLCAAGGAPEAPALAVAPQNIAPTATTAGREQVNVIGEPRMAQGHPCTLWDQEDIVQLKKMLATSPGLQAELARLTKEADNTVHMPDFAGPVKLHLKANGQGELTAAGKTKP